MCVDEAMVDFEEFVAVAGGVLVRSAGGCAGFKAHSMEPQTTFLNHIYRILW